MELCHAREIRMTYGREPVLRGVNLGVPRGGILALIGENGSGKSTLLRILAGIQRPDGGALEVAGRRPRVGYMPENCRWYPYLTGAQVLRYFARFHGVGTDVDEALLRRVGLWAARDKKVAAYSKGMKQKLGLAQALLGDPQLLILDEPTNGLDPRGIRDFYAILAERAALGVSVVLSSHLLAEIEDHVTHVAFLRNGGIVDSGGCAEMLAAAGLPSSVMVGNIVDAELLAQIVGQQGWRAQAVDGGLRIDALRSEVTALLQVLAHADLEAADIEVCHPGLEELYLHTLGDGTTGAPRSDRCSVLGPEAR